MASIISEKQKEQGEIRSADSCMKMPGRTRDGIARQIDGYQADCSSYLYES